MKPSVVQPYRWNLVVLLCLLPGLLLAGCTGIVNTAAPLVEPEAGQWQTWVLASVDEVRPAAPPDAAATQAELVELKAMAAALTEAERAQVAYWNAGSPSYRWTALAIDEHAAARIGTTPLHARNMALLNVAIYDATVAAWEAKALYGRPAPALADPSLTPLIATPGGGSYPSEHAVAAGAAETVLSYLFPDRADAFAALAEEAARSRLLAGVNYPSDVEAGLALGRAVAEQVVARGMADGSDAVWDGTMPTEPGHWTGENPVQPLSGTWQTWLLASGDAVRPPPPPAYDSELMQVELTALKAITPTFATTASAFFWQSPRGLMQYTYGTTNRLLFENGLDANPPRAALVYAAMSTAQADSFIACYDAKYAYWSMRPSQVDPTLVSLFPSPNFPSYPSAHGCQTAGVVTVLAHFFPGAAAALWTAGEETMNSRLWAGIHFQSDLDAGRAIGEAVGALALERLAEMAP